VAAGIVESGGDMEHSAVVVASFELGQADNPVEAVLGAETSRSMDDWKIRGSQALLDYYTPIEIFAALVVVMAQADYIFDWHAGFAFGSQAPVVCHYRLRCFAGSLARREMDVEAQVARHLVGVSPSVVSLGEALVEVMGLGQEP
jgi:hypothetical protein